MLTSTLVEGTFPPYEDVIPKSTTDEFRVTVADLMAGLRRASLLTTRDALSVELLLDPVDPRRLILREVVPDTSEPVFVAHVEPHQCGDRADENDVVAALQMALEQRAKQGAREIVGQQA